MSLHITHLEAHACHWIPCLDAAGRRRGITRRQLPVLAGRVEGLPDGLDTLVLAADLQARAPGHLLPQRLPDGGVLARRADAPGALVGELVAAELATLQPGPGGLLHAIEPRRTCVALSGDLFVVPMLDRRGGLGCVASVWRAFADRVADHLVGVLGNHDLLDDDDVPGTLLDGDAVDLAGLRVGGVSGVIGAPHKPNRHHADHFCDLLAGVLTRTPDLVLLHQSPEPTRVDDPVRETLALGDDGALVASGHRHWDEPLVELDGRQVINVDSRVVVLQRA